MVFEIIKSLKFFKFKFEYFEYEVIEIKVLVSTIEINEAIF